MNPETGEFHKLATQKEKAIVAEMMRTGEDSNSVRRRIKKEEKNQAEIKESEELIARVEITKRAIIERWPIFQVGQVLHLEGHDFKVVKINEHKGIVSIQSVKYGQREPSK